MTVVSARANVYGADAADLVASAEGAAKSLAGKGQVVTVELAEATLTGELGGAQCWSAVATIDVDTDPDVDYTDPEPTKEAADATR